MEGVEDLPLAAAFARGQEIHSRVKSGDADEVRTHARYRTPLGVVGLRAFTSDATAPDIPGGAVPTLPASPRAH